MSANVNIGTELPSKYNINIARVNIFFHMNHDRETLKVSLTSKRDSAKWNCTVCNTDVHIAASLVCDDCLEWNHQNASD